MCQHSSVPTTETCSLPTPEGRAFWWTRTLWTASAELPVLKLRICEIREFDEDCWFGGRAPSCREVAEHARRIQEADLAYPVILGSDGQLMDGGHRIAKAWIEGREWIDAVRFISQPEPDWLVAPAVPGTRTPE